MHHQLSYVPLIGPAPTVDSTMDLSEARQRRLISRRGRLPPEHGGKVLAADKARQIKCSYDIGFSKSNRFDGGRVPALSEYIASQRSAASRALRASTARAVSAGVSRHAGGGGAQSSLLSDVSMSRASARSQASVRERPSTTTAASRRHDQDRRTERTEAEKWGVSERNLLYRKMVVGGHDPPAFSFGQAGRFRVPRTGGYNAGEHKLCFSTVRHDRRSWRKPFYLDRGTKRGGAGGGGGGGRGGRKGAANSVDLPLPGGGDRLQHALGRTRSLAVAAKFAAARNPCGRLGHVLIPC